MTGVLAGVKLEWKEALQTVVGAQCKQGAGVSSGNGFVPLCSMVAARAFELHLFGMLKWDMKMGPASGAVHAAATEKLLQNLQ